MNKQATTNKADSDQKAATRKHICIDFEGEGKRAGKSSYPSLLGALVPNTDGKGKRYRLWVFEPELQPLTRSPLITGQPAERRFCTLEEALAELLELAGERNCRLVAFTEHELNIIDAHLPKDSPVRQAFSERFYNIRPKAKSLSNRRGRKVPDITLENLLLALSPGHKFPPPPKVGAAEACRRLRKAGAKSGKWKKWAPRHQQLAIEVIAYNRGDCDAVWRLVNRVSANYRIKELS